MVVSRKVNVPKRNILSNKKIMSQVNKLGYLGATIAAEGRCTSEISS